MNKSFINLTTKNKNYVYDLETFWKKKVNGSCWMENKLLLAVKIPHSLKNKIYGFFIGKLVGLI
jgi:hypothetical protein